jgi:hypothetical protein
MPSTLAARRKLTRTERMVRALPWIAGSVLAIGLIAFVTANFFDNSQTGAAALTPVDKAGGGAPVQDGSNVKEVKIDPRTKRLMARFVHGAVFRENLAASYRMADRNVTGGMSLKEWMTGNIPVVPMPKGGAIAPQIRIVYSYPGKVLYEIALFPPVGSKVKAWVYRVGLVEAGRPGHHHWLIDYIAPRGQSGSPLAN